MEEHVIFLIPKVEAYNSVSVRLVFIFRQAVPRMPLSWLSGTSDWFNVKSGSFSFCEISLI